MRSRCVSQITLWEDFFNRQSPDGQRLKLINLAHVRHIELLPQRPKHLLQSRFQALRAKGSCPLVAVPRDARQLRAIAVILREQVAAARTGAAQNRARHMLLIDHGVNFAPVLGEHEFRGNRNRAR